MSWLVTSEWNWSSAPKLISTFRLSFHWSTVHRFISVLLLSWFPHASLHPSLHSVPQSKLNLPRSAPSFPFHFALLVSSLTRWVACVWSACAWQLGSLLGWAMLCRCHRAAGIRRDGDHTLLPMSPRRRVQMRSCWMTNESSIIYFFFFFNLSNALEKHNRFTDCTIHHTL